MDKTAFSGRLSRALVLTALAAPFVVGCAGNGGLQKQVAGLETQVTAMRADQDRLEERLAALELGAPSPHGAASPAAERIERPRLKVIHLEPAEPQPTSEQPAADAPQNANDSSAHRPIIRGTGDRVIKVGDGDSDESTSRDNSGSKPVAALGKDAHGS